MNYVGWLKTNLDTSVSINNLYISSYIYFSLQRKVLLHLRSRKVTSSCHVASLSRGLFRIIIRYKMRALSRDRGPI